MRSASDHGSDRQRLVPLSLLQREFIKADNRAEIIPHRERHVREREILMPEAFEIKLERKLSKLPFADIVVPSQ